MIKKILPLLFIIFIVGLAFFFSSRSTQNFNTTVSITDEAFVPNAITIKLGSTVTWKNEGVRDHWPASNYHPTHTLYPEGGGCLGSKLDACKGLKTGEEFSFKFDKEGIWPMHDHLYPGIVMTVTVVSELSSTLTENQVVDYKNVSPQDFRNLDYAKQLSIITAYAKDNPEKAWEFLKKSFVVNGQVVGNAHEFSHIIGGQSYKKSGLQGIDICDATFAFGCFHGVTEAMLLKEGLGKIKSIQEQCLARFAKDDSNNYASCIHGTGHGLYTWEGGNLQKALNDCNLIDAPYSQYCYDGVFMENAGMEANNVFDAKSPWKFCANLDEKYHVNCARYQVQIFLSMQKEKNSFKNVGSYCSVAPSDLLKNTCYESLGYNVADSLLGALSQMSQSCSLMPESLGKDLCMLGAAKETVFQKFNGWQNSSKELCSNLSGSTRTYCFDSISR